MALGVWEGGRPHRQQLRGLDATHSESTCETDNRASASTLDSASALYAAGAAPAWDIGAASAQDKDGPLFDASAMAVTTATGREHKDSVGGGDCEDATMGRATTARRGDASLAAGGGGGDNAACPTAGDGMNGRANEIAATTEG